MSDITIPALSDYHVHIRNSPMMERVAPWTSRVCGRALLMPNTQPPLDTSWRMRDYQKQAARALGPECSPLFAFKLTRDTALAQVEDFAEMPGVVSGKLYPGGVTTNSEEGFTREELIRSAQGDGRLPRLLRRMASLGLVLCVHAEMPGDFCLEREDSFLPIIEAWLHREPSLRLVIEHVTRRDTLAFIRSLRQQGLRVAGTITLHHLELTLDDVIGDRLRPHHFCKPVAKHPDDRAALLQAATAGEECFFLGSDSAPHLQVNKECGAGCAGVFTAPCLSERLADIFERAGALDKLAGFVSHSGDSFYDVPASGSQLVLTREPWRVPHAEECGGVVPYLAGQECGWKVLHRVNRG